MKNFKRVVISLLTNPILIIGYFIFCYELASLCRYGRVNNNIYILLACIVFFVVMIIFTVVRTRKTSDNEAEKTTILKVWRWTSIVIILAITFFFGVKIYKSAVNYGGKLSWVIERLQNERSVKFKHNNIYENGVEGIFNDINEKYTLPEKLYMASSFNLKFNADGTITSFDTFVYGKDSKGKDSKGKDESFLISYDKKKSKDIKLILNGYAKPSYDDEKLVEPLIETVKVIPVKNAVSKWNESKYGLLYYGKRSWGYNSEGIINIGEDGNEQPLQGDSEIIGYTVSLFIPGKERQTTPLRYNLKNNSDWSKSNTPPKGEGPKEEKSSSNNNEEFYLSSEAGYKLNVVDKAMGRSFYTLSKTTDGGKTWYVINGDPFADMIGGVTGIVFLDDKLGFIATSNKSSTEGVLYRTNDGGVSFKKISYPPYNGKLYNDSVVTPFDFPSIPYEKDGVFNMVVGQGSDGDYNGNSKALYKSKDKGETWEYVSEVKNGV